MPSREPRAMPVGALDAALWEAASKLDAADRDVADFLDKHIDVIDAYDVVTKRRSNAYGDVRGIERAVRQLGYVLIHPEGKFIKKDESIIGDRTYSSMADEAAARARKASLDG